MNWEQRQQVLEQLPAGSKITKIYNAFENGETRVIVKMPGADYETRYAVKFGEDGCPNITHKP